MKTKTLNSNVINNRYFTNAM